jgi:hypothetical protein
MIINMLWQRIIKSLALMLPVFLLSDRTYGNESWQCTSSKYGITIMSLTDYDDTAKSQKIQDAFLDKMIDELDLQHLPLQVLILINQNTINFPRNHKSIFSTIAYDTIRPVDFYFFYNRFFPGVNNSLTKLPDTLDYGATSRKDLTDVGLKIVFEYPISDTSGQFDRIYTLVKYGVTNIDKVKNMQGRIFVNSDDAIIKISIRTIDTSLINNIPTISLGFDPNHIPSKKIPFIPLVIVGSIAVVFYGYKKLTRRSSEPGLNLIR